MGELDYYPVGCRKNIRRLMKLLCTDANTAYSMILLTAVLSDYSPYDSRVVDCILNDCNVEVET